MPNMYGQPHPWETAGMEHADWMRALGVSIEKWMTAANRTSAFFEDGGAATFEELKAMFDDERSAEEAHRKVYEGDRETCLSLLDEYRPKR